MYVKYEKKFFALLLFLLHIFLLAVLFWGGKKKRERRRRRRHVAGVLFRQVSFRMFVRFVFVKENTHKRKEVWREEVQKKKTREREKEKTKTTKHDFLLLKYKIIIWTVHFFFFSFFTSSLVFTHTIHFTRVFYSFKDTSYRLHGHWRWR
jgi:hypothetical protein